MQLNSQEELKRIAKAAKSLVHKYGKYWPTDCVPKCTDAIKALSTCHDLFKTHGQLSQDLVRKHLPQPVKDIAMDYYNRRLDLRNKHLQKTATAAAASTPPRDSIPR
ncbi:hypothetical protein BGZ46_000833 [Entomortierella lignicola]|nr:hypothetical protein BGZ46_000833 [Entomortierella lignicola]